MPKLAGVLFAALLPGALALPGAAQEWKPTFKSDQSEGSTNVEEVRPKTRAAVTRPARAKATGRAAQPAPQKVHRVAIQVDENNPQVMNLALNNARNVAEYYQSKGENVAIEIVTFGPGLHMLRDDTSPVKQRISAMALETPSLTFIACGNTQANMSKQESKPITLIGEAKLMPSGVVRLMELQGKGYAYIRP
jgi:intracellular sulfur oxidation DsrE/DsrF family protein